MVKRLRQAHDAGEPYHIVHFDGHGGFLDLAQATGADAGDEQGEFSPHSLVDHSSYPHTPHPGQRGYLLFENPGHVGNRRFVDGPELGQLLADTGVSVLVMNACQSAKAGEQGPDETPPSDNASGAPDQDSHQRVRAFGSFAQEVLDTGIPGVLAMQYNLWVATAAQLVGGLYADLARGRSFGQAASACRKQLQADPLRDIANEEIAVHDWCVPVAYEAAPIRLLPEQEEDEALDVTVEAGSTTPTRGSEIGLPEAPEFGFIGRDETLLALDRAFDEHKLVLLEGRAGCGKTQTAAEFARWYSLTGGVGPVFFTSFERHTTLTDILGPIEQAFGGELAANGIHWLALEPDQQRDVALQVLNKRSVLWIWDNVEPITGFPAGTESDWSQEEQDELRAFLRELRDKTQAKVLLTSRRDERQWLGDLPRRIAVRPMPMIDRETLARAIGKQFGRDHLDMPAWRPLLAYTQGNPLTIRVVVGQAIRDKLKTAEQIRAFAEDLLAGEAEIDDEQEQGRDKSLGASLSYGFDQAFTEDERKILALLHLFQGFVDVDALRIMGSEDEDWRLPELAGLTSETAIALLDRAADIGLVTSVGEGYYTIHPALPLHFRELFEEHYPGRRAEAERAFAEAMGELGNHYHSQYQKGNRGVIAVLAREEPNILHAWRLARTNGWWDSVISAMQGPRVLYDHRGRRADWARCVREILPEFCDPETDGPLSGRENAWGLVTEYRVHLYREARDYIGAEQLQRGCVERDRRDAQAALALPPHTLTDEQRETIRDLSASVHGLAQILREQGKAECIEQYREAIALLQRIGNRPGEAVAYVNIGQAYKRVEEVRDLDQAEQAYRQGLELMPDSDELNRGKCHGEIGSVALERFDEARAAGADETDLLAHLNAAADGYHRQLALIPETAVASLAVAHNQLGGIYEGAGDVDRAAHHWQESIRHALANDDRYGAADPQFNMALMYAREGRFSDALAYGEAALCGYSEFGDRARDDIDKTQGLIEAIKEALQKQPGDKP